MLTRPIAYYRRRCWAIATGEFKTYSFVGRGWFEPYYLPHPREACYVALFPSRRAAREGLAKVKGPARRGQFPHAYVVRVTVTIV